MDIKLKENSTPGGEPDKPGNPLSAETGPTDSGGGHPSIVPTTLQNKLVASSNYREEVNIHKALATLKNAIKQQNKAINRLLEATDQLLFTKEKSKSNTIINAIDQVTESAETLRPVTNSVHNAFYEAEKAAIRGSDRDQKVGSLANQEAILKVCDELKECVSKQQEDINALKNSQHTTRPTYAQQTRGKTDPREDPAHSSKRDTEAKTPHQGQPTKEWSEVRRSKAKTKTAGKPRDTPKTPGRSLSDAIAVRPETGETYTDILKTIKEKVDIDAIGSQVASIRESRNGEILIRLKREDTKREELVEALKSKLGSRADIRGLVRYDDIEIQDLDRVTTDTEVETSIRNLLGLASDDKSIKVKNIRPANAGTQRATVRLKSIDALNIAKKGRIKIGWIYARARLKASPTRCFRCLGYGHTKHACNGPDRTKDCSLCGSENHKAVDCKSTPTCAACKDLKVSTDHYPGSGKCTAYRNATANKNAKPHIERRESANAEDTPNQNQDA